MNSEGPLLESLTHRLAECPADFLAEPLIGKTGAVNVAAIVSDLLRDLGGARQDAARQDAARQDAARQDAALTPQQAAAFQSKYFKKDHHSERNRLRLTLVTCWLLHDAWFKEHPTLTGLALWFLSSGLNELAGLTQAQQCVADPDRREELVRLCLKGLGLRPAGETEAQAQDRLATLNTSERQRVIAAARAAEARAQDIRRKMAEDAARVAEAKGMPE